MSQHINLFQLHCVISLGMGRHERPIPLEEDQKGPKSLSLAQKFSRVVDAATDTEITHINLHDLLPGSVYFRFNPYMSDYYPLDDARPAVMDAAREDTKMYLRRNHNRIVEACKRLQMGRSPVDKILDSSRESLEILQAKASPFLDA